MLCCAVLCRRELREIEASAAAFQAATEEASTWEFDSVSGRKEALEWN